MSHIFRQVEVGGYVLYMIQTTGSNIKLVNLNHALGNTSTQTTMQNSGYYGMNGSFYNVSGNQGLLNITMDSGATVGVGTDSNGNLYGKVNSIGSGLIAWDGSILRHYENITNASSISYLTNQNTWGQGGIALHLGSSDWLSRVESQPGASAYTSGYSPRSAMIINVSTNDVYLIMTSGLIDFATFRARIQQYFGISDGTTSYNTYKGIMLDGGTSSQIRGIDGYGNTINWPFTQVRKLAALVTLKNP